MIEITDQRHRVRVRMVHVEGRQDTGDMGTLARELKEV